MKITQVFFAIVLIPITLIGCSNVDHRNASANDKYRGESHTKIEDHIWDTLYGIEKEQDQYGLYTYVLFPRNINYIKKLPYTAQKRYIKLIEDIISIKKANFTEPKKKSLYNIFYIPGHKGYENINNDLLNNYNSNLAFQYLDIIKNSIDNSEFKNRLITSNGPFLITTKYPVKNNRAHEVLLYADLSNTNYAAIAEVVLAYKSHVINKEQSDFEKFNSLKTVILSYMLEIDDNINFIKLVLADTFGNSQ